MAFSIWKVGGSLFDLPDLGRRLKSLREERFPGEAVVVIPGGGAFADVVRQVDQVHHLPGETAHRMALQAMRISAAMVAQLVGEELLDDPTMQQELARQWKENNPAEPKLAVWDVIDVWDSAQASLEKQWGEIPTDWSVTSDSIAAALAWHWGAEKLVLCKSIDRPANDDYQAWADAGMVDRCFPRMASDLPSIEWINLRAQ
ncbi:hypothetical protein GC197_18295 [bacterium]|nr:hypothetical protein [bacterium]